MTKLAIKDGKLIAADGTLLVVPDDGPCCHCDAPACAPVVIVPHTIEVTVTDVFTTTTPPGEFGADCDECDDYNDTYELPHDNSFGVPLPCSYREIFPVDCTFPITAPPFSSVCEFEIVLHVALGSCINGDSKCELYVTCEMFVQRVGGMSVCDPFIGNFSAGVHVQFGEDGDGCGDYCSDGPFETPKKTLVIAADECGIFDIRGESITIPMCSYVPSGTLQPTCWSTGGGEVTIQF